jgi:hypothetical protein
MVPVAARPSGERAPAPRLVPPPPVFAWKLLDPFNDRFELWAAAGTKPIARLAVGGLPVPSATVEAGGHRFLLTAKGVGNRWVAISDAATDTAVADFEWQRVGRMGTLRLVEAASSTGAGPAGGVRASPWWTGSAPCCCASARTAARSAMG